MYFNSRVAPGTVSAVGEAFADARSSPRGLDTLMIQSKEKLPEVV